MKVEIRDGCVDIEGVNYAEVFVYDKGKVYYYNWFGDGKGNYCSAMNYPEIIKVE